MDAKTGGRGIGTVLVLGGGGARGAAQVGVLGALAERGIRPDACVGTSVGALNAAICAAHPLDRAVPLLEEIWATPETARVLTGRPIALVLNQLRRRPYLRDGEDLRRLVRRAFSVGGVEGFESLRIPLHVLMTDLLAGVPLVATDGSLDDALCASASVPGVFPPVLVGGRPCVDGGVTENCGLATAAALQPEHIIAIDLTSEEIHPGLRRFGEVVDRVRQVALQSKLLSDFDRFSNRLRVTLICPTMTHAWRRSSLKDLVSMRRAAFASSQRLFQRITQPDGQLETGMFQITLGTETI
jgi:predicted acylesterase/phospholipase RssA